MKGLPPAHLSQRYQWEFQPDRLVELLSQLSTLTLEDAHAGTTPGALSDHPKYWIPGWRNPDQNRNRHRYVKKRPPERKKRASFG
jgi:hypothetical protein